LSHGAFGQQKTSFKSDIQKYQAEQNKVFKDERTSPLNPTDIITFKELNFYRPRNKYKVVAQFVRTPNQESFEMPTTTDRKPVYEKYGELHFKIKGKEQILNVYQSHDGRRNPLYRNNLFLPFKDLTNGNKTYGGGRFIDLVIPKSKTIVIDFNKAYNPYCAYSPKYSCPIVPKENYLTVPIKAGVKAYSK